MFDPIFYGSYETKIENKFRTYIRCELCKFAEKRAGDKSDYVHCTKYSNMLSHKDATCKSSVLRGNKNEPV